MPQPTRRDHVPPSDRRYLWGAGALLALPMIAIGAVPLYATDDPHLAGWPFFFWYQTMWVFLTAGCTSLAYVLVKKARGQRREDLA